MAHKANEVSAGSISTWGLHITVPIVVALGLGLSNAIPGRNPVLDGFGMIAMACMFPIIAVMAYAQVMQWLSSRQTQPQEP